MKRWLRTALFVGASACILLCAGGRTDPAFTFGFPSAAAALAEPSCTVVDANGVSMDREDPTGEVTTSTLSGRCDEPVDTPSPAAAEAVKSVDSPMPPAPTSVESVDSPMPPAPTSVKSVDGPGAPASKSVESMDTASPPAPKSSVPAVTFELPSAADAVAKPSCAAVVDANGVSVSRRDHAGEVFTSISSGRCKELVDTPSPRAPERVKAVKIRRPPAPKRVKQPKLTAKDARPEPPPEPAQRSVVYQHDPLQFASDNPERVGAALLTSSAMLWVLHSSVLTSLLMLGLPLWRHVDLLPIVTRSHDDEADAATTATTPEELVVGQMLEKRHAHAQS